MLRWRQNSASPVGRPKPDRRDLVAESAAECVAESKLRRIACQIQDLQAAPRQVPPGKPGAQTNLASKQAPDSKQALHLVTLAIRFFVQMLLVIRQHRLVNSTD